MCLFYLGDPFDEVYGSFIRGYLKTELYRAVVDIHIRSKNPPSVVTDFEFRFILKGITTQEFRSNFVADI